MADSRPTVRSAKMRLPRSANKPRAGQCKASWGMGLWKRPSGACNTFIPAKGPNFNLIKGEDSWVCWGMRNQVEETRTQQNSKENRGCGASREGTPVKVGDWWDIGLRGKHLAHVKWLQYLCFLFISLCHWCSGAHSHPLVLTISVPLGLTASPRPLIYLNFCLTAGLLSLVSRACFCPGTWETASTKEHTSRGNSS